MADTIIWHNPKCSTSRTVLGLIRNAGVDPVIRDYLKDAPDEAELQGALAALGMRPGDLVRRKGPAWDAAALADADDAAILAAMVAQPVLIERPVVFSPKGARLGRPVTAVLDILPPQRGAFTTERGQQIIGPDGRAL